MKHMLDNKIAKETKKMQNLETKNKEQKVSVITFLIILLIVFVVWIATIYILDKTKNVFDGKIVSLVNLKEKTPEEKVVETAIKRFKELGETGLKQEDLEVLKILRKGDYYYYISSPNNSLEIRISDGKIVRENSILVEQ